MYYEGSGIDITDRMKEEQMVQNQPVFTTLTLDHNPAQGKTIPVLEKLFRE